jgi:hypothetical protein
MPKEGGRRRMIKSRKSRKPNMWAKAAGEYYRAHSEITDFSEVLKSPKFKEYYRNKYGKNIQNKTQKAFRKGKSKWNKNQEEEMVEAEEEKLDEEIPKKNRKSLKQRKVKEEILDEEDDGEKKEKEEDKWSSEWKDKEKKVGFNKDYFNGGKKDE